MNSISGKYMSQKNNKTGFIIYNAIKTPDGTILHCENEYDFRQHFDKVSLEVYSNDGGGHSGVQRSVNKVPYEDLSVSTDDDFDLVRKTKFWGSYGKSGNEPKKLMSLEEMEDGHIEAILSTQRQIRGTILETLFMQEQKYRRSVLIKNTLDSSMPEKKLKKKGPKV